MSAGTDYVVNCHVVLGVGDLVDPFAFIEHLLELPLLGMGGRNESLLTVCVLGQSESSFPVANFFDHLNDLGTSHVLYKGDLFRNLSLLCHHLGNRDALVKLVVRNFNSIFRRFIRLSVTALFAI